MTARRTFIYRLVVDYPSGIGWLNPPEQWLEDFRYDNDPNLTFHWPQEKRYMSRSGAEKRAGLFRRYGCTVTIERSNPVTWP